MVGSTDGEREEKGAEWAGRQMLSPQVHLPPGIGGRRSNHTTKQPACHQTDHVVFVCLTLRWHVCSQNGPLFCSRNRSGGAGS